MQKIVAEVNLRTVKQNALLFKEYTNEKLFAVVKADAYGHGAVQVVNALSGVADGFCVATVSEGIAIRSVTALPIFVLTPSVSLSEVRCAVQNRLIPTIGNVECAREIAKIPNAVAQIKINTGMNRYGVDGKDLVSACEILKKANVRVFGAFSHLYSTESSRAKEQLARFLSGKETVERYFDGVTYHLSATGGIRLGKEYFFDAVRIGIGLYGYGTFLPVKKAMKVKGYCVQSRVKKFGGAGYGENSDAEDGDVLSVIRGGYADGFARKRKNGSIGNEKNVAQLCMDACIRRERLKRGEYVLLTDDAEKTATALDTIPYEILCSVTKRAEFHYVYE